MRQVDQPGRERERETHIERGKDANKVTARLVIVSISMLFMDSVSAVMMEAIETVVSISGRLDSKLDSPGVHCPGMTQQCFHETGRLCR